ncbi:DarT ssDNA thymidine ADP-ribosyltransferase family protein [Sphingobium chungbukense]|uniref:DarT ssDNA thymidine ADP-ribosyltransferase family protein n=1 Tax=Sphingobium chungbukense TaxID=56193 RepID=UPI0009FF6A5E|nr:DarT ssDNA thymidine ADP-ribosyltransferase family protein [Sphingobium chungbukense]
MALSHEAAAAHIARWQAELNQPWYNYRRHWPDCLFHHAPIENAVSILSSGMLRSRNDAANPRPRDVAARDVNAARDHAHDRVRLYFRPRTPTQFNIEGIRKPGECRFGDETHAPMLVMFILDAQRVLTAPGTQFCDRNMQRGGAEPGDGEAYFARIPFDKVYHEGPTGGDDSIIAHRCAEVLPTSPLELQPCLRAVFLRSDPERDTLLHLLGPHRARWAERCYVSEALRVFEKRYSFIQEIGLQSDGLVFTMNVSGKNPPRGGGAAVAGLAM